MEYCLAFGTKLKMELVVAAVRFYFSTKMYLTDNIELSIVGCGDIKGNFVELPGRPVGGHVTRMLVT